MDKRLKTILSKILGVSAASITDDSSPGTISSWDSFNALMLVSELEAEFKVSFTMKEVTSVHSVLDIKKVLKKYNIS